MRSKLLHGVTAVLAAVLTPTAQASVTPGSPPRQWEPNGLSCGYVALITDPINPQATHYAGEIDCEEVWTPISPTPRTNMVNASVTASIQTGSVDHGSGTTIASCTVSGPGPAAAIGACLVTYNQRPSEIAAFCITYTWTEGHTTYTQQVDFDPVAWGNQCTFPVSP